MPRRALSLPEPLAAKVRDGCPVVAVADLPPSAVTLDPGRPLLLVDSRGEVVASGVADPENGVFRILSSREIPTFDAEFFRTRVVAAHDLRKAIGLVDGVSAYRLVHGEGDGLSGFTADVFGPWAVVYCYSRGLLHLGRLLARAVLDVQGAEGVVLKLRPREGPTPGKVQQEVLGREPPEKLTVLEGGIPFEVHLLGGLNVGLFTDMREHRRGLRRFVAGRRVLNVFAYTGSLSVAAALGGAVEVTSVDLSSGVLKWARENFRLSGLDPDAPSCRFEVADAIRFLRDSVEAGRRFDTIILDPPTYSAARASKWSMKNDYPELIALAARLLPEDRPGLLWASANVHRARSLVRHLEDGLAFARRRGRVLELGGLPPDYPTPLAFPEARYLEVCQVEVGSDAWT